MSCLGLTQDITAALEEFLDSRWCPHNGSGRYFHDTLGYGPELLTDRLRSITPERLALWDRENAEQEGAWCDPFITRLPPPHNPNLDVDEVTDLLKYVYATLSRAIADLQY